MNLTNRQNKVSSDNKKRIPWKKAIGFMLAFALFLSITTTFLPLDFLLGFLSRQTILSATSQSHYVDGAYQQFQEDLENLAKRYELPSETLDGVVSENRFIADSGNSMTAALAGKHRTADTDPLEAAIQKRIQQYFDQRGIPSRATLRESTKEMTAAAASLYRVHTSFHFGEEIIKAKIDLMPFIVGMIGASLIAIFALVAMLMILFRGTRSAWNYITYALTAAVAANLIVAIVLYIGHPMELETASDYYKTFIDHYFTQSLIPAVGISAMGAALTGALVYSLRRIKREG